MPRLCSLEELPYALSISFLSFIAFLDPTESLILKMVPPHLYDLLKTSTLYFFCLAFVLHLGFCAVGCTIELLLQYNRYRRDVKVPAYFRDVRRTHSADLW